MEAELEDLRQYSRRTNILIHGVEEEAQESTDNKVMSIINNQLQLPERTHRLRRKVKEKKRPIIARFVSYRKRKTVFDAKKKFKGTRTVITENLTKDRYALYKQCIEEFSRENVWTLDGRIYCLTGKTDRNGRQERLIVTREEDLS